MKDYPYNSIKQDQLSYQIMLLHDQRSYPFTQIAKQLNRSTSMVKEKYYSAKIKQIRLYMQHISIALDREDTSIIKKEFDLAYQCYQDWSYACAYLEKKYPQLLTEYRAGEPGMSAQFLKDMPPFRSALRKKTIDRVIHMREAEKASYRTIAEKLHMTPAKAKHTYDGFYHQQVLTLISKLEKKAENPEEKRAVWERYFSQYQTPKKRYDALIKEISEE